MAEFSLSAATNLFKTKYGKLSENVYNSANVTLARVKKSFDFTGNQMFVPNPLSFQGGVGSGSLPTANVANYEDAIITSKKMYGVAQIERESIKASMNDEGAFVRATKEVVRKTVESWMRNMSRTLWWDGTGSLARGDGATNVSGAGTTGSPYVVVLNSDTKEANVEERDFWNYDTETTNLEVTDYVPSTNTVSLVGTSVGLAALAGAGPVPVGTYFHLQGSKDNDPSGIKGTLDATSGSLYTIPVQRRWRAGTQIAAGGAGITTDFMNTDMLEIQRKSGKVPDLIITSFTQFRKILNLLEDQKEYIVEPRAEELKGRVSFKGVEFMSAAGAVPIFPERFIEDDRIYYINSDFIEIFHRPDFGWFDDDGTVFLRTASSDSYEARYGGYLETYVVPTFHGVRTGLAT
jgi:hypothetical protein